MCSACPERPGRRAALAALALLLALGGCEREKRDFPAAAGERPADPVALSTIAPGGAPPPPPTGQGRDYENNAYHLSQGKQLYAWFNCKGCHAAGGGDSGPALMDSKWIYGGAIENIAATIRDGRPNGMPAFGGKIPEDQIWEIAGYVRSMSGNVPASAAPNRDDHMQAKPAENRAPPMTPGSGNIPPAAEQP